MGFWRKNSNEQTDTVTDRSRGNRSAGKKFPLWLFFLCIGVVCLGIGAYEEQFVDLYRKAVMICLECIGIG